MTCIKFSKKTEMRLICTDQALALLYQKTRNSLGLMVRSRALRAASRTMRARPSRRPSRRPREERGLLRTRSEWNAAISDTVVLVMDESDLRRDLLYQVEFVSVGRQDRYPNAGGSQQNQRIVD